MKALRPGRGIGYAIPDYNKPRRGSAAVWNQSTCFRCYINAFEPFVLSHLAVIGCRFPCYPPNQGLVQAHGNPREPHVLRYPLTIGQSSRYFPNLSP